jgi:hypothetical protein
MKSGVIRSNNNSINKNRYFGMSQNKLNKSVILRKKQSKTKN